MLINTTHKFMQRTKLYIKITPLTIEIWILINSLVYLTKKYFCKHEKRKATLTIIIVITFDKCRFVEHIGNKKTNIKTSGY